MSFYFNEKKKKRCQKLIWVQTILFLSKYNVKKKTKEQNHRCYVIIDGYACLLLISHPQVETLTEFVHSNLTHTPLFV